MSLRCCLSLLCALCLFGTNVSYGQARQAQSTAVVSVTLQPAPSVCTAQGGSAASVTCLTSNSPVFSVPGRTDVTAVSISVTQSASTMLPSASSITTFQTASQVPSTVNVSNVGPTAAGGQDTRTVESATLSAPAGTPPPEEIEVTF